MSLLEVRNLKTYFYTDAGVGKAVDDVSFSLDRGKTLGIVGESGCGKSVTSLSIMRLVDPVTGRYEGGEILFDGKDILKLPEKEIVHVKDAVADGARKVHLMRHNQHGLSGL